jgi:hypothetical protein
MADQMQIPRFCVRWYTIVVAADKDGAEAGNHWLPSIQTVAAALVVRAMGLRLAAAW